MQLSDWHAIYPSNMQFALYSNLCHKISCYICCLGTLGVFQELKLFNLFVMRKEESKHDLFGKVGRDILFWKYKTQALSQNTRKS